MLSLHLNSTYYFFLIRVRILSEWKMLLFCTYLKVFIRAFSWPHLCLCLFLWHYICAALENADLFIVLLYKVWDVESYRYGEVLSLELTFGWGISIWHQHPFSFLSFGNFNWYETYFSFAGSSKVPKKIFESKFWDNIVAAIWYHSLRLKITLQ